MGFTGGCEVEFQSLSLTTTGDVGSVAIYVYILLLRLQSTAMNEADDEVSQETRRWWLPRKRRPLRCMLRSYLGFRV